MLPIERTTTLVRGKTTVSSDSLAPLQALLAGQYTLERELGRGGMGVVYLARDIRLDRPVAIKVLPRALAADPELRERFLREARTSAQLSHPNIVPIYRADEIDGVAFFTMGFVDGENLAERLRARGPLPPAEAVRVLREAAWALAYAHARGVVHRDVKPENIMIERGSNRAIVTDFGIAQNRLATPLTQGGMVLGSVHYMSPEQAAGDKLDGRSDLYSLGVVGFQILSGRLPFEADEAATVMAQQVTRPAPSLSSLAPNLPHGLVAVIDRCLSKSPDDRYPDRRGVRRRAGDGTAIGGASRGGGLLGGSGEHRSGPGHLVAGRTTAGRGHHAVAGTVS